MDNNWAELAIEISQRFGAYIIPLADKNRPMAAINKDLPKHKDKPIDQLPSTDPNIIRKWARTFPGYGVMPGDAFLIIDVDIKDDPKKGRQHGKECMKFLKEAGLPTDTFVVKSPSGGMHFYYQHPIHYDPIMGANVVVKFEDAAMAQKWEAMRAVQGDSSGIDTRYGLSYVAGPGSVFDGKSYELLLNKDLASIPPTLCIGVKQPIVSSNPKAKRGRGLEMPIPGSIKMDRNTHAKDWTFQLAITRQPEGIARPLIQQLVLAYDNSDGEAPTYDEVWSMYERATEKLDDVVAELLATRIYIVKGRRVLNIHTGEIIRIEELQGQYENRKIPVPAANGSIKMVNPVIQWINSPDRLSVHDEMFDISLPHGIVDVPLQKGVSQYYNKFIPPDIISFDHVTETDMGNRIGKACIQIIENIVTSPYDREWFRKWVGQMLFDPGMRPAWHWHIFSNARGIGKDTLADIIAKLYGVSNVARFGTEAFEDKSNTEFFNTGLGIMSDFTPISGQGGKSKVLAQFKALTGSKTGRMRAMYADGQQRTVSLRFIMLSNSYNDFPVDSEDRRLFKCESKGIRLKPEAYNLAHCFIEPEVIWAKPEEERDYDFDLNDVRYAHALLVDYFLTSGYEEMLHQYDCPQNDIKDENQATTEPKYFQDIRRAIEHELYIFAADVITKDMLGLFLKSIRVDTSPSAVLQDLLDKGILQKIERKTTAGSRRSFVTPLGMMVYDEDMLRIRVVGKETNMPVYACRNFHHWCNLKATRRVKDEIKKIINYPNIKDGWSEKTAAMLKNNITPIDDK